MKKITYWMSRCQMLRHDPLPGVLRPVLEMKSISILIEKQERELNVERRGGGNG
jgi:hypothetical protein